MVDQRVDDHLLLGTQSLLHLSRLLREVIERHGYEQRLFDDQQDREVAGEYLGFQFSDDGWECVLGVFFVEPELLTFETRGCPGPDWRRMKGEWHARRENLVELGFFNPRAQQRRIVDRFFDSCIENLRSAPQRRR